MQCVVESGVPTDVQAGSWKPATNSSTAASLSGAPRRRKAARMRFLHPRPFRRNGIAVPAQRGGGSGATASRFRRNGVAVPAQRGGGNAPHQDHAEDDRLHPGRDPDHDSLPRKLGDLLKFYPTARGKVDKPSSVFNPDTCSGVVAVCALKGLERSVDLTSVHFVNVRTGVVVTVSSIMSVGSVNDGAIRKAREIRVAGKNLQLKDAE